MSPLNVLVTGAYGLVGGVVYRYLDARPEAYTPYALARRRHGSDRVAKSGVPDIPDDRFILSDLSDLDVLVAAMQGIDVVVHMAADPRDHAPWESVLASNIIGTRNVFEAARLAGVKRVIYASSLMVSWGYLNEPPYSLIAEGRFDEITPADIPRVTVDWPTRPTDYYPASKVMGEALGRVFAETHGLSVICIRIGGVEDDDRPVDEGWSTAVWCSKRDIARMVECAIQAPDDLRYDVFYGVSDNKWCWVDLAHGREVLGWVPLDSVEAVRREMAREG